MNSHFNDLIEAAKAGTLTDEKTQEFLRNCRDVSDRTNGLKAVLKEASDNKHLALVNRLLEIAKIHDIDLKMTIFIEFYVNSSDFKATIIEIDILPTDTIEKVILKLALKLDSNPEFKCPFDKSTHAYLSEDHSWVKYERDYGSSTLRYKTVNIEHNVRLIDIPIHPESHLNVYLTLVQLYNGNFSRENFLEEAKNGTLTENFLQKYLEYRKNDEERIADVKEALFEASSHRRKPVVNRLLEVTKELNVDLKMLIFVGKSRDKLTALEVLATDTIKEVTLKTIQTIPEFVSEVNSDPNLILSFFSYSRPGVGKLPLDARLIDVPIHREGILIARTTPGPNGNISAESKDYNQSTTLFKKINHTSLIEKIITVYSEVNPKISQNDVINKWVFEASFLKYLGITTTQDASCTFRSSNDELKLPSLPSADALKTLDAEDTTSTKPSQYANSVRFKVKLTAADLAILEKQCQNKIIAGFTPIANANSWYHVFVNKEQLFASISEMASHPDVKKYLTTGWFHENGDDNQPTCAIQ